MGVAGVIGYPKYNFKPASIAAMPIAWFPDNMTLGDAASDSKSEKIFPRRFAKTDLEYSYPASKLFKFTLTM
jgi:hypothetical protein